MSGPYQATGFHPKTVPYSQQEPAHTAEVVLMPVGNIEPLPHSHRFEACEAAEYGTLCNQRGLGKGLESVHSN